MRVTPTAAADRGSGATFRNRHTAPTGRTQAATSVSATGPWSLWDDHALTTAGPHARSPADCPPAPMAYRMDAAAKGPSFLGDGASATTRPCAWCHRPRHRGRPFLVLGEARPRRSVCDGVAGEALEATRAARGSSTAFRSLARRKRRLGCLRPLARHDPPHAGGEWVFAGETRKDHFHGYHRFRDQA